MGLTPGSSEARTGLAGDIRTKLETELVEKFDLTADAAKVIDSLAYAIVEHIKDNAVVTVTDPSLLVDTAGTPPSPAHTGSAKGDVS